MMRWNIAIIILTFLLAVMLYILFNSAGSRPTRRNVDYMPDMVKSYAYQSQTANPFFDNKRTNQREVEGAMAHTEASLPFGSSPAERQRAATMLTNPFADSTRRDIGRGETIYRRFCALCHGNNGGGIGPVTRRGFPPPPSLLSQKSVNREDGALFHIITFGFKNMPAYGAQIDQEDRWQVINYLRKLQRTQP